MWLDKYITEETEHLIRVDAEIHCFKFELLGNAPVQGFGEIKDREFYFRARHSEWMCEVSDDDGNLPSDGRAGDSGFFRNGKFENASYMTPRDAIKIIDKCIREYLEKDENGSIWL